MYLQKPEEFPPPPGIIGSLRAGFDAVSSHVVLILLPIVLDIFLWLGPRLSVDALLRPVFTIMFVQGQLFAASSAGMKETMDALARFNLLSLLSRLQLFPIGVSSLFAQQAPVETPFGSQQVVEVSSGGAMVGLATLIVVAGWIIRWVSGTVLGDRQRQAGISSLRAIAQTLILSALWMIALMALLVPSIIVFVALWALNRVLASVAIFVMLVLSFWLVVPLFFTPHGIFIRRQNAFSSIFTSMRMARFTLPTSGLFVVCVLVLSNGLNYLWNVPPDNSWMKLVGIAGHAFIATALLAASFVYYRDMNVWLQTVFEQLQQKQSMPTQQV
jgi:hypothetical protein